MEISTVISWWRAISVQVTPLGWIALPLATLASLSSLAFAYKLNRNIQHESVNIREKIDALVGPKPGKIPSSEKLFNSRMAEYKEIIRRFKNQNYKNACVVFILGAFIPSACAYSILLFQSVVFAENRQVLDRVEFTKGGRSLAPPAIVIVNEFSNATVGVLLNRSDILRVDKYEKPLKNDVFEFYMNYVFRLLAVGFAASFLMFVINFTMDVNSFQPSAMRKLVANKKFHDAVKNHPQAGL